ncbi:MAG: hypothetical protein K0B07_02680 [DPANN group archaeon]|nr:hypothetical protein [DPANN group archaeon]
MSILAGILGLSIIGSLGIVWYVLILVLASLPLYFAVKFLGGEVTILKVILLNFIVAIISGLLSIPLLGFILLLFIYKKFFELSWLNAFLAWILQFVVGAMLIFIAIFMLGIALV